MSDKKKFRELSRENVLFLVRSTVGFVREILPKKLTDLENDLNIEVKPNTKNDDGIVSKGINNPESVWKTDKEGNPSWLKDSLILSSNEFNDLKDENGNLPKELEGVNIFINDGENIEEILENLGIMKYAKILYNENTKEDALNKLNTPTLIFDGMNGITPYLIIFEDTIGDSPIGLGTSIILGYTFLNNTFGSQMIMRNNFYGMRFLNNGAWTNVSDGITISN